MQTRHHPCGACLFTLWSLRSQRIECYDPQRQTSNRRRILRVEGYVYGVSPTAESQVLLCELFISRQAISDLVNRSSILLTMLYEAV